MKSAARMKGTPAARRRVAGGVVRGMESSHVQPATAGWLMVRQLAALDGGDGAGAFAAMKRAATRFYLDQVVPEAIGLKAAATAPAAALYAASEEAFAG